MPPLFRSSARRRNTARCSREVDGTMRAPVHRPSWSTVTSQSITGRRIVGRVDDGGDEAGRAGAVASTSWCSRSARSCSRIPAFLAPTNLGYDDGGYGLAAVAMRQGFDPFRDIFSSQGPLFLPLVRARRPRRVPDVRLAARPPRARRRGRDRRGLLRRARADGPRAGAARGRRSRDERRPAVDDRADHERRHRRRDLRLGGRRRARVPTPARDGHRHRDRSARRAARSR